MAEYGICVKEILKKTVIVNADSLKEALEKVQEAVDREEIILGPDDYDEGEVLPREDWEDGLVPEGKDVSCYRHLKQSPEKQDICEDAEAYRPYFC